MATIKAFWKCWMDSDPDGEDIDQIKGQLQETKNKLEEAQKIISRLKFEKLRLMNNNFGNTIDATSNELSGIQYSKPISTIAFSEYSTSTMIVHNENTIKQESALDKLEEKVMEKYNATTKYDLLSDNSNYDSDNIFIEENEHNNLDILKQKHKQQINELMKQIDKLSKIVIKTENDKNIIIENKNKEIKLLKKQIEKQKQNQIQSKPEMGQVSMIKTNSFSQSMNMEINNEIGSDESNSDSNKKINQNQKKIQKKIYKNHYDDTKEQIEILNNDILKYKSLGLINEQLNVSDNSNEKGIIVFFQKYLKSKTIEQIFEKSGRSIGKNNNNSIENATGLVNVLSFVTILYKVKVFRVKYGKNKNPKINNSDIKNMVKYLSIWIVRTYGQKQIGNKYYYNKTKKEYDVYNFKISKNDFGEYMIRYLKEFVKCDGKHIDAQL